MMSEECLGCEWYNKPYWSIISPCTNCPKRFKNNTIKVTKYSINIDKTDLYKRIEELRNINEKLSLALESAENRIDKAIEIIESYNLGKYDYSIPPGGITDLLDLLRGKDE